MNLFVKGLAIAVIHVCFVAGLGAKLLYDRATRPRVWVQAVPYDPTLPIRGRYVSLQLMVEPRGIEGSKPGEKWQPPQPVALRVENGLLLAESKGQSLQQYRSSGLRVRYSRVGDEKVAALDQPVAFFIPEHVPDPSRRPSGEQLWVETTIPKKGMPRPIRLGVKKEGGQIVPLDLK